MIKYGQFVKLTHSMEVNLSVSWTRIAENYRSVYKEVESEYRWSYKFILPEGTVGLLKYLLVNQKRDTAVIAIPDPVTKRITNVTLAVNTSDFTFDVLENEMKPYLKPHRKFVAQKITDGFKAIDLIEHAKNYRE